MSTGNDKRCEHIAKRYGQHKSLRKTAEEFGTSKSTVHRVVSDDNRAGRLHDLHTDRGTFRMKDNKMGGD